MRTAPVVELSSAQRSKLQRLGSSRSASIKVRERAAIILLAADGLDNKMISVRLGHDQNKVGRWRKRFASGGIEAILKDKSRPGRIPPVSDAVRSEIISLTIESKPAGSTHWSRATMARKVGVSESTAGRVWAANGLKPHRVKTFKLSNDKRFEEKLDDIVGLYLSPPEHAIVLSCDEKSRIQALDRAQPGLPLKKGRCETMTHDYKRNGTTPLFAALDVASGRVTGKCMSKHRHQEWISFLNLLDRSTPPNKEVHVIGDNYATHKHAKVLAWQKRHRRFHFHFTPTSASWLNMVERFFRDLTVRGLLRGVFRDVPELIASIGTYLDTHNADPKPFVWTASATDILEKAKRGRAKLNNQRSA